MKFKFLYWAPRISSILLILFLSMFALDIFDMGLGFWGTIVGLFIHLIPSFVLIILLVVAWKYELVGGIAFISAGILYIILLLMKPQLDWYMLSWSLTIAGPAFIVGILWILNWKNKKNLKKKKK